jgi:hypothetical protein
MTLVYLILNLSLCFVYLELLHILTVGIHDVRIICLPLYLFIYLSIDLSLDNARISNIKYASRFVVGGYVYILPQNFLLKSYEPLAE